MSVRMMGANVSQEQQAAWAAANGSQQQPQDKRVAFLAEVRTKISRESRERGGRGEGEKRVSCVRCTN